MKHKQIVGYCKYCGAELSDYRDFCDQFCKTDFEEDQADDRRDYPHE